MLDSLCLVSSRWYLPGCRLQRELELAILLPCNVCLGSGWFFQSGCFPALVSRMGIDLASGAEAQLPN